jgi:long-chain acyl-CoA synthetase
MYSTVLEAVLAHAEATPDKVAVADRERRTTSGELAAMIRTAAANLRAMGVRKGDRVMLAAVPYARFVAAYFGCHYIGAVACPVDKNAVKDTLLWMRDFLETDAVFYEGPLAGELGFRDLGGLLKPCGTEAGPPAELDGEDLAAILFTGATTGKPKGVMLTHGNFAAGVLSRINGYCVDFQVSMMDAMPLFHIDGLTAMLLALHTGGSLTLVDGWASVRNIYNAIKDNACNIAFSTPAATTLLVVQTGDDICKIFGSLRVLEVSSAPVPVPMKMKLVRELPGTRVYDSYGSTEASDITALDCGATPEKLSSIGKAIKGVELRILDDKGKETGLGVENAGRLAVSGGMVMTGYWKNPEATAKCLIGGQFVSADIAYQDDEGYVYILGRKDDVINMGGHKVSPLEIEDAAYTLPYIGECCCIGVDDPEGLRGSVPVLYVTVKEGAAFSEEEITSYFQSHLDKYKVPHRVLCVEEIPKNPVGKPLKRELKRIWEEEHGKV